MLLSMHMLISRSRQYIGSVVEVKKHMHKVHAWFVHRMHTEAKLDFCFVCRVVCHMQLHIHIDTLFQTEKSAEGHKNPQQKHTSADMAASLR